MFKITDLTKLDISFKEYTDNCLSGVFKPLAVQANNELKDEDAFNRLAIKVIISIDALVNDKIFKYLQDDYDKFKEVVGQRRAELTKSAIYNEIQFRSNSNYDSSLDKQIQTLYTNLSTLGKDDNSVNTPYQTLAPTTIEILKDARWGDIDDLGVGASEPLSDIIKELDNKANKSALDNVEFDTNNNGKVLNVNNGKLGYADLSNLPTKNELDTKANKDALNNVTFNTTNNGKILKVDNGKVDYLDPKDITVDTSELEKGIETNKKNIEQLLDNQLDAKDKLNNLTAEVDSVKTEYAKKDLSNLLTEADQKQYDGYYITLKYNGRFNYNNLPKLTADTVGKITWELSNVQWYDKTATKGYCLLTTGKGNSGVTFGERATTDLRNVNVGASYKGKYLSIDDNGKVTFSSITTSGGADKMDTDLSNMSVNTKYANYGVAVASDGKVAFKEFADKNTVDMLDDQINNQENGINVVLMKTEDRVTKLENEDLSKEFLKIDCTNADLGSSNAGKYLVVSSTGGMETKELVIPQAVTPYEAGTDFKQSVSKPNWKFISCNDLYNGGNYSTFFAALQKLAKAQGDTYTEDEYIKFLQNVGGSTSTDSNTLWTNAYSIIQRLINEQNITIDHNELVAHAGEVLLFGTYGEASAFYAQHGSEYCQYISDNLYLRTGDNGGTYGSNYIAQSDLPNVSYDTSHTHQLCVESKWNGTSVLAGGNTSGNAAWISGYCNTNGPTIHLNGNVTQTEFTPKYRQVSAVLCLQDIYRDVTNSANVDNPLNWFVNWKA